MRKSLKYFLLVIGFISLSAGLLIYRHEQLIFDEPLIPELAFLDGKAEKEPMNQRQTSLIEKGRQAGEIVAQWSNEVTVSDDEQALSNFDLCKDPNPSDAVILRRLLAVNAEALDDFYNLMKFPMIAHLEEPKMGNPPIFPGRLRNTLRLIRAESCLLAFEKKPIETAFKSLLDLDQFIHTSLTQNTTLSFLEAAIGVRILKENREQLNRMEEFDRVSKALPALRLKFEQNQIDRNELLMKIRQHELLVFYHLIRTEGQNDSKVFDWFSDGSMFANPWSRFLMQFSQKSSFQMNKTMNAFYRQQVEAQNHPCLVEISITCPEVSLEEPTMFSFLQSFFLSQNYIGETMLKLLNIPLRHYQRLYSDLRYIVEGGW